MEHETGNAVAMVATKFEDQTISTIESNAGPRWMAQEIATALGYGDQLAVVKAVRTEWSDEFTEGVDFEIIGGPGLRALKAAGSVKKNAPSVMVLTETGVNLAAILSRQPRSQALRRWLASEVLPSIRRSGTYAAPAPAPAVDARAIQIRAWLDLVASGDADLVAVLSRVTEAELAGLDDDVLSTILRRLVSADPRSTPHTPEPTPRDHLITSVWLWAQRRGADAETVDVVPSMAARILKRASDEVMRARARQPGRRALAKAS